MSGTVSASMALWAELERLLEGEFNGALAAACAEYGITPFAFNWGQDDRQAQNCWHGNWTLGQLAELQEPELPGVAWWVGGGQDLNTERPRTFSGQAVAGWRFFLAVPGKYPELVTLASGAKLSMLDVMRAAVEAALLAVLLGACAGGVGYRKDLSFGVPSQMQWLDQDQQHVGWVQEIEYNASFEVNV